MARCQLTEQQKDLIRSLVPGLRDGTVDSEWTLINGDNGLDSIKGISNELWDTHWHKVRQVDIGDFLECGFLKLYRQSKSGELLVYHLHQQKILDTVDSNFGSTDTDLNSVSKIDTVADPRKVFVVHGRDTAIRKNFFHLLRSFGLKPMEWEECVQLTGKSSPYVGEVLDVAFKEAQAVIILMTPDDIARLRTNFHKTDEDVHERILTGQARPNVIFEAGMAMAHKPDRTVFVEMGKLRPFTDVGGRLKVLFDGSAPSRNQLAHRLISAGCLIDMTGSDWLEAVHFDFDHMKINEVEIPSSKLTKGGNVWWLFGDLLATSSVVAGGNAQLIEEHLVRCLHHATELELSERNIIDRISAMIRVSRGIFEGEWTTERKQVFHQQLESIRNDAGQAIQNRQPDFRPDPY